MKAFIYCFTVLTLSTLLGLWAWTHISEPKHLSTNSFLSYADSLLVLPVNHGSVILEWKGISIYVDPVGGAENYQLFDEPDLILITDIHADHFDLATLDGLDTSQARIILPQAVADSMPPAYASILDILNNNDSIQNGGTAIKAIPMYNLRPEALAYHPQGRGNGYVLERYNSRVYISGDTEDIPEMRNLTDINLAIVCMNLPYTMSVDSAVSAVLDFAPDQVIPYHYKGNQGFSDIADFKTKVESANNYIEVILEDFYPAESQ